MVLPDLTLEKKREWGNRMWTLTEVLLSASSNIKFCSPEKYQEMTKMEIAAEIWQHGESTSLLAEHYTGLGNLSCLALIYHGLKVLSDRKTEKQFTPGDVAYALGALVDHRPKMNPEDNLFQALARLFLANDSDRILERMVCMLPDPSTPHETSFVLDDALGAKLWDIEPLCQIVGVGNADEIILGSCQAISICWKKIPQIAYNTRFTRKKIIGLCSLPLGPLLLFIISPVLAVNGFLIAEGPIRVVIIVLVAIIFFFGLALVFTSPWSVIAHCGGKDWDYSPWLIGFEGVLPILEIERLIFGNAVGRLRPDAAPDAAPPKLPDGHRSFTLVDTKTLTVSVFSAERPPGVALICGKEGGRLRVVLCSYQEGKSHLHKETVMRMGMAMLSHAVTSRDSLSLALR